ncbi:MAG: sulfatase-like hydrolase/transferase [Planctomycetes bacterium]|nr:sulfatase-like hydrolase/transferase [Planctomycetota bacterium]
MNFAKMYLVALFVVFLHFAAQITTMTAWHNRDFFFWDRYDGVAIVSNVFAIALLFTLPAWGFRRLAHRLKSAALEKVLGHVFLLALISGVFSAVSWLQHDYPSGMPLLWMAAVGVVGFSLAWPRSRLVLYAANACLVFSPVVFLLSIQMLFWEDCSAEPRTEFTVREATGPSVPVFVFIFDEWSYARSTRCGEFRPFFQNLRRLSRQSVVLSEAISPADHTTQSLPRFLFQTDRELLAEEGRLDWIDGDTKMPAADVPSLLQIGRECGHNTYMLGFALRYDRLLGDHPDYCHTYPWVPRGETLLGKMGYSCCGAVRALSDPLAKRLRRYSMADVTGRSMYRTNELMRDEMFDILRRSPQNTFAVFHLPPPHEPYIYNEDGTYHHPSGEQIEGYERNLAYLDRYIGQITETLQAAGKFEDALLVITSDHSWRTESEPYYREGADAECRVPLIIKLPGQQSGRIVERPICTNELQPLFEAVFHGEHDPQKLMELLQPQAGIVGDEPTRDKTGG